MGNSRYARLLSQHPIAVVAVVLVIVVTCTVVSVLFGSRLDFSDPLLGFVPRYTHIHGEFSTWKKIVESTAIGTNEGRLLTTFPVMEQVEKEATAGRSIRSILEDEPLYQDLPSSSYGTARLNFFCDVQPDDQKQAVIVFSISDRPDDETLLSYKSYTELCRLQGLIEDDPSYIPYCQSHCLCKSFSLVNTIAFLNSKHSCQNVTSQELVSTLLMVSECLQSIQRLNPKCWQDNLQITNGCNITDTCMKKELFDFYYYLTDKETESKKWVSYTATFLHLLQGEPAVPLYRRLYEEDSLNIPQDASVKLVAMNLGLKEAIFERSLLYDTGWIGVALFLTCLIMWIYTESFFITCMCMCSMLFALIISYALYTFVFRIRFFPFLNLLACVVVVGVGADDLFIFWKTWTAIKLSRNASILERIVTYTLKHASAAMFVTSATTATAFFGSAYVDLVTVRCFCIYTGTCVLANYILTVTWIPACVVLYEKHALTLVCATGKRTMLCNCFEWLQRFSTNVSRKVLEKLTVVAMVSFLWLPALLLLAIGGSIAIFVWPKLSLPSASMFQVLADDHPFERYDGEIGHFRFAQKQHFLSLTFVWGADPTFNGNYFEINSVGVLQTGLARDLFNPQTQQWFADFCYDLRQQPFFGSTDPQHSGCFIEELRVWMRLRSCTVDSLCCKNNTFPYSNTVFDICIKKWSLEVRATARYQPGPRYANSSLVALMIRFSSNVEFTYNYQIMSDFYSNVSTFLKQHLSRQPEALKSSRPFFTAENGLLFFDIQKLLIESIPTALYIVIGSTAIVIFLTTLNILLTICSLLSICCSILTTIGILALMGWELNVLESLVLSLAIGLSMDYTLHVAVAYRIAHSTVDRRGRVAMTLQHVGGSILAAMLTTLLAGLSMLPANVLAYKKLGIFLAIVASSSWIFSILFMPSLLIHIGPIGSFMQISCWFKKRKKQRRQRDKTVYSDEVSSDVAVTILPTLSSHLVLETVQEDDEDAYLSQSSLTADIQSTTYIKRRASQQYTSNCEPVRLSPIVENLSDDEPIS